MSHRAFSYLALWLISAIPRLSSAEISFLFSSYLSFFFDCLCSSLLFLQELLPPFISAFLWAAPFFTSFLKALSYLLAVHWSLPYSFKAFCTIFLYLRRNCTPFSFLRLVYRAHIFIRALVCPSLYFLFAVSACILSFQPCIGFIPSFAFLFIKAQGCIGLSCLFLFGLVF